MVLEPDEFSEREGVKEKTRYIIESINFEEKLYGLLEEYSDSYFKDHDLVNDVRDEEYIKEILDNMEYTHKSGGKRLRPAMAYASYFASGGEDEEVVTPLAAAIENIHAWTLIVDDWMDEDDLRRGDKTLYKIISPEIAVQTAFMMNNIAYKMIAGFEDFDSSQKVKLTDILFDMNFGVADGQIRDILAEQKGPKNKYMTENRPDDMDYNDFVTIASEKTSSLIKAATEGGAIIADADEETRKALEKYGTHFGITYQIRDDLLDFQGDESEMGKSQLMDARDGKLSNIVLAYALEDLKERDKDKADRFLNLLREQNKSEEEVQEIVELMEETEAKRKSKEVLEKHSKKARESLEVLESSQWRKYLEELLEYNVKRSK